MTFRRKVLTKWRQMAGKLDNPKSRPNDFQRLVISANKRGMNHQDATRVFGLSPVTVASWCKSFSEDTSPNDLHFFIYRAHRLGASDEVICQWFGIDRADKVAMIIAETELRGNYEKSNQD